MNSLVEKLETRPNTFILLIGGYFLLNLIVRVSLPNSLEMDGAGQIRGHVAFWRGVKVE